MCLSGAAPVTASMQQSEIAASTAGTSLAARLFLFTRTLGGLGPQTRHRLERQQCKMSVILIDDHIGRIGRQPNVVRMRHRILLAVGHAESEGDAALDRRLNLLSRHKRNIM